MTVVAALIWSMAAATGVFSAYLLVLTALAALFRGSRGRGRTSTRDRSFAVLIPAHNEELLIGPALLSIGAADYPGEKVSVYVIADNCQDLTAEIARDLGAIVLERTDLERWGKGAAVEWALAQFDARKYDAIAMVDADSTIGEGFFRAMNLELDAGAKVIQGYYCVSKSGTSTAGSLRSIGFALMHYVRPLGKRRLGGSCGLKGNGMVFDSELLSRFGWESFSVTEDAEQHVRLLAAGYTVRFAPDAVVYSEMPTTLSASRTQNMRWEAGRIRTARRWVPRLVGAAFRNRSLAPLDAAFELALPPISVLGVAVFIVLASAFALGSTALLVVGLAATICLTLHVIGGLLVAGVPPSTWRSLFAAPVYMLWKLGVYAAALVGSGSREWIRTGRPPADS